MKRYITILLFLALNYLNGLSQTVIKPNQSLKSPETLEISKIEMLAGKTVIYLTIENRIAGGYFCADRNIYILDPAGNKYNLVKATGIPVCPDTYSFKSVGEKLSFTLTFPPLKEGTGWIDIVEDCPDNCFWFYGITLDNELNKTLDDAFLTAEKGSPADNMNLFKGILDRIDNQNPGIEGLLYINIINAAVEDNDKVNALVFYKRLAKSNAPRVDQYLKYLNDRGIKY